MAASMANMTSFIKEGSHTPRFPDSIVNTPTPRTFLTKALVPPLAAVVLVLLFTSLGLWQLDRAEQKRALQASFASEGTSVTVTAETEPPLYEHIRATGRFLGERQFLIDNIVQDGRLGFYVITPLELDSRQPLLLVNRGWLPRRPDGGLPDVGITSEPYTIDGRAGQLPRVGLRPGKALDADGGWPRTATYPTLDELATALQRPVLPYVMLADPDPASGFVRRWEPQQPGPSRNIGYAFQWFALATAVVVITVVVYRKGRAQQ